MLSDYVVTGKDQHQVLRVSHSKYRVIYSSVLSSNDYV